MLGGVHHWRHGTHAAFASTSRAIGLSGLRRTAQRMGCLLRVSAGPHCSAPGSARLVEKCGPLLRSESTGDASTAGCRLRHSGRSVGRSGWDAWPPRGQKLRLAETIRCDGGMPPVDALVLKSEAAGCSRFPHLNGRETRSECAPVRNHATHRGSLVGCRYADSAHLGSGQCPVRLPKYVDTNSGAIISGARPARSADVPGHPSTGP